MDIADLLTLASTYSAHTGRSEATVSNLALGRATLFSRLRAGGDCTLGTAHRVVAWFDTHWPADLEWPAGIARPEPEKTPRASRKAA